MTIIIIITFFKVKPTETIPLVINRGFVWRWNGVPRNMRGGASLLAV
jgi:hypothetical protein